jgi:sugar phosphate isomerase/epimerase
MRWERRAIYGDDMKTSQTILSLALALLGAAVGGGNARAEATQARPHLGVQLWSVKEELRRDFEGTLAKIAQLGFEGVEFAGQFGPYRTNPAALKLILDKNRLQCAGAHVNVLQLAPRHVEATTSFYRALGCRNLVISMDTRGATPGQAAELSSDLTVLSAKMATENMRIGFHNHAQEMTGAVGSTPWDVIARNTPKDMILQQDVGWTTFAGKDPVAYVRRYPGRSITMHFKAKAAEGSTGIPIIGQDKTDWTGLIRATRETGGTEWIIIEQEEYPDGMAHLDAVAASLQGLEALIANVAAD